MGKRNEKDFYYFVHSYFVKPNDATSVVATYDFGGHQIPAIVSKDNLIGCQFHPEFLSRPGQPHPLFRGLIEAAQNKIKKEDPKISIKTSESLI